VLPDASSLIVVFKHYKHRRLAPEAVPFSFSIESILQFSMAIILIKDRIGPANAKNTRIAPSLLDSTISEIPLLRIFFFLGGDSPPLTTFFRPLIHLAPHSPISNHRSSQLAFSYYPVTIAGLKPLRSRLPTLLQLRSLKSLNLFYPASSLFRSIPNAEPTR